jgi:hypothetical protein
MHRSSHRLVVRIGARWSALGVTAAVVFGGCLPAPRAAPRVESVVWRNDDVDDTVLLRADVTYRDEGVVDELFQQVGDVSTRFVFDTKDDRVSEVTVLQGDTSDRAELTWEDDRLQSVTARHGTFKDVRNYKYRNDDARFVAAVTSTRTDDDGAVLTTLANKFGYDGDRILHADSTLTAGDTVTRGGVDFAIDDDTRRLKRIGPDKDTDVAGDVRPALTWELVHDDDGRLASASTLDENQRFDLSYGDDGNVDQIRIRTGEQSSRVTFQYEEGDARGLAFGLDSVFGLACPVFPLYDLRGHSSNQLATDTFEGAFGSLLAPTTAGEDGSVTSTNDSPPGVASADADAHEACLDIGYCFGGVADCAAYVTQLEQQCDTSSAVEAWATVLMCLREKRTCSLTGPDCSDEYANSIDAYNEFCVN